MFKKSSHHDDIDQYPGSLAMVQVSNLQTLRDLPAHLYRNFHGIYSCVLHNLKVSIKMGLKIREERTY